MASTKRKADNEIVANQKSRKSPENRALKRQRKHDRQASPPNLQASSSSSVLKQDERAFPRGGGSVLTPLEHKQIQIQATRDVLFEQSGKESKRSNEDGADEFENEDLPAKSKPGRRQKKRSSVQVSAKKESKDEAEVRIEGISYKVYSAFRF